MARSHGTPVGSTAFRCATPWGDAAIEVRGPHVTRLRPPLPGGAHAELPDADDAAAPAAVHALAAALRAYLAGEPVELATPDQVGAWLDAAGVSGFRRDVSLALFDVPRGVTVAYGELAALAGRPGAARAVAYGELAALAGRPGAARAVGTACARNPLPIVVPCHRVVHAGARPGDVGSYGAATGSDYKRRLLELERAALVRPPDAPAAPPRSSRASGFGDRSSTRDDRRIVPHDLAPGSSFVRRRPTFDDPDGAPRPLRHRMSVVR